LCTALPVTVVSKAESGNTKLAHFSQGDVHVRPRWKTSTGLSVDHSIVPALGGDLGKGLSTYLEYWRIHAPRLVPVAGTALVTIDPTNEEEMRLRASLHEIRLDAAMREHEAERTHPQAAIPCLFCTDVFDNTWHAYMQWLEENTNSIPGVLQILSSSLRSSLRCALRSRQTPACSASQSSRISES
jgi:hypothetical protein